jgi:Protein of unknown function (DUF2637)
MKDSQIWRKAFGYILITIVMVSVAAMSWSGLYGFAHQTMQWTPVHAALVPVALDIAALASAIMALDSVARNDSAIGYRSLAFALVCLSAFVNWRHALGTHNVAEQVFFPAMSVLSYALIHLTLVKYRRDARRDHAGVTQRVMLTQLPRMGFAVWLPLVGHPLQAFTALSGGLADRITVAASHTQDTHALTHAVRPGTQDTHALTHAVRPGTQDTHALTQGDTQVRPGTQDTHALTQGDTQVRPGTQDTHALTQGDPPVRGTIADMTQSNAIRYAIKSIGANASGHDVTAFLAEHGVSVSSSRVTDVKRRDAQISRNETT